MSSVEKSTESMLCDDNDSLVRKYLSIYHNLPIGVVSLNLHDHFIENYNPTFESYITNFIYPKGIKHNFENLIFRQDLSKFKIWCDMLVNDDVIEEVEGTELRLICIENGMSKNNIQVKIDPLYLSKDENLIILAVNNIDTYININKKIEEEKFLLEQHYVLKNKMFLDTYIEIRERILDALKTDNEDTLKTILETILPPIENLLKYYNVANYNNDESYELKKAIISQRLREKIKSMKILIVDDIRVNQIVVEKILKNFIPDIHIDIANNGQEALDKILETEYNLVFMDLMMPVMDGYEAIEKIRDPESPYHKKFLPIIALTAATLESDKERAIDIGVNAYLTKPVKSGDLIKMVEKFA